MTSSNQKYLKAVYTLSKIDESIRVVDIAAELSVSKASVCSAMKRLERKGFVKHELYGDVRLSPAGKKAAKAMITSDLRIKQYQQCAYDGGSALMRFGEMAGQTDG